MPAWVSLSRSLESTISRGSWTFARCLSLRLPMMLHAESYVPSKRAVHIHRLSCPSKILSSVLAPVCSFFYLNLAPLCRYHSNIWHRFLAEYSPKHSQVFQRRSRHPTLGNGMHVNDGGEIVLVLVTIMRSASIRASRRRKLTFARASQRSWSGSPYLTCMYH
jgi:hypothetical protein